MASVVWSTELLALLGAPPTPANYKFLNQWVLREHVASDLTGNMYGNNPFFTTAGGGGTVGGIKAGTFPVVPASVSPGANRAGVALYPSIGVGTYINAYHIAQEYPTIHRALRSGNPASFANNSSFQTELTAWSGGGYSGFASIPAPSGPVGASFDVHAMMTDMGKVFSGKLPSSGGGGITGAWKQGAGDIAHAGGGAIQHIPGVKQAEAVTGFLGKLTDPSYILRALQVIGGAALVGAGGFLLVRQVALAADLPDPTLALAALA